MYFSSLKLFEVLKFFQFLMLFENQFLDTSSNFGAPNFFYISGFKLLDINVLMHSSGDLPSYRIA